MGCDPASLDCNGNTSTKVVGSNTTSYAWDYEKRLTSVTLPGSGGTVSFKYDPFGRRIYKSTSSTTSVFAYDGDNLAEETNSSGTAVARYAQGLNIDEPLAMLRSSTTSYYQADGLGSVTSLSNTSGAIANSYTYESFGNLTASTGSLVNPFRYTARESDTETGLYYYRARYYDQSVGRLLSEDPTSFRGGNVNFYVYVNDSPPNFWDPFGLTTWPTNYPVVTDPFGTIEPIRGGRIHKGEDIGQHVNEGDIIGQSNGRGNVKPHLHYTRRECPSCPQIDPSGHLPSPAEAKPCGPGGKCSK